MRYYIISSLLPVLYYVVILVIDSEAVPVNLGDFKDIVAYKFGKNGNNREVVEKKYRYDNEDAQDQSDYQQKLNAFREIVDLIECQLEGTDTTIIMWIEKIELHAHNHNHNNNHNTNPDKRDEVDWDKNHVPGYIR